MKNNRKIVIVLALFVLAIVGYLCVRAVQIREENIPKTNGLTDVVSSAASDSSIKEKPNDVELSEVPEEAKVTGLPQMTNAPLKEEKTLANTTKVSAPTKKGTENKKKTDSYSKKEDKVKRKPAAKSKAPVSGTNVLKAEDNKEQGQPVNPLATPVPTSIPIKKSSCKLLIQCQSVLSHLDKLSEGKKQMVPKDGIILRAEAELEEGDTVYDVLIRECRKASILTDIDLTFSAYVKGINHLYEKDLGSSSGWLYRVNGKFPNAGIKGYKVSAGDQIEFVYSCERGDVTNG